jgi:Dihaem cytochrome c
VSWARRVGLPFVLAVEAGCVGLVHPQEVQVAWAAERWPDVTLADLEEGREVYVAKCSSCHVLRRPDRHPPDAWPDLLDQMVLEQDVELTPAEHERILQYIEAASAIPKIPKSPPTTVGEDPVRTSESRD